jgi:tRNA G18 (ribose-2'-O)-methylase SpoU
MNSSSVDFFKDNKFSIPEGSLKPILIAWKLRTPQNYGNLLRLADNLGCGKVYFVKSTGDVCDRKIKKTARRSWDEVDFEFIEENNIWQKIPENYQIVALETIGTATNIFTTVLPKNLVLVVGNEKGGLSDDALTHCSSAVFIPITGGCTSLNVTHATAIALFEWLRQQLF